MSKSQHTPGKWIDVGSGEIQSEGTAHRFMDRPEKDRPTDHQEDVLWTIFKRPEVKTVAECHAELIERNLLTLETCEQMADFTFYPGQRYFLSRVATKDFGLLAADTGAGKTLIALSLIQIKAPNRALIVAPQGTMRSSVDEGEESEEFQASQWIQELRRFCPGIAVFELFSMDDYRRILKANGGVLPFGVFISYYQAMYVNGARESCPDSWDNDRLEREVAGVMDVKLKCPRTPDGADSERHWAESIGKEENGIRCVMLPSMATQIGHLFDFVALDESHVISNLDANTTNIAIRMQPKYRYLLTATPIPNIVSNLFAPMGWLCVHDWYKGGRLNAAWPYARNEIGRFNDTFLSVERDHTEEEIRRSSDKRWRGKVEKTSPIISSPARLLKLLKPTVAYISKQACNPNLPEAKITEIRVPLGIEQARLYGWFMNRGNIPCKHPLIRARKQIAYLRNICADPAGFGHGGPTVHSNFNPKTIAVLSLIGEILAKGQQCVVVCSRIGQTNTFARRLTEAGVPFARIDSTIPPEMHSSNSNLFKNGKARVMLMGILCAVGHSFSDCQNLIIGSLEYSYGSLHQAKGRIDRVNSKHQPNIYCVLHSATIETVMFEIVANKQDSATICLHGQRVPRDFLPVDMSDVMASAFKEFKMDGSVPETDCEQKWPALRDTLRKY